MQLKEFTGSFMYSLYHAVAILLDGEDYEWVRA
jgi:hypothetical protein